ncbi:MAG TPA: winged helix-turn-helix domain-containing protein, partial [Methylomirabilota bacterium]|nr:winged helix-turn-helix domain-containing protein [Methylomirabilota bacterium]
AERERGVPDIGHILGNVLARERQERWLSIAEFDLELEQAGPEVVDVKRLADIYEDMRDYKLALRDRVRWRLDHHPDSSGSMARRAELTALDAEIEWLQERASLWRRRELESVGLYFDPVTGTMVYRGRAVGLSRLEAALLRALLEHAGRPCSASQLIQVAWDPVRTEAQLRNYVVRLRDKLQRLQVPAAIKTIRGRGYCLATDGVDPEEEENEPANG